MKYKKILDGVVKMLSVIPAIFVGSIYCFLLMIGGHENMAPFSWVLPLLYVIAAALLVQGKWWGCIPGIAAGLLITGGLSLSLPVEGQIYNVYFAIIGVLCYLTSREKGKPE